MTAQQIPVTRPRSRLKLTNYIGQCPYCHAWKPLRCVFETTTDGTRDISVLRYACDDCAPEVRP